MQHESTTTPMISVRSMSKLFGEFVALDRLGSGPIDLIAEI